MPFTPTHILAVVPIGAVRWLGLPFSALVIGSMIPDLTLFVPVAPAYRVTHSMAGLLTANLPIGLAIWFVFQGALKEPMVALLPRAIQARCAGVAWPWGGRRWPSPGLVVGAGVAVVIGAATHVFWDGFTHQGAWATRIFPVLNEPAGTVLGRTWPWSKVLQMGSSAVGLPVLAALLAAWLWRRQPEALGRVGELSARAKAAVCLAGLALPGAGGLVGWMRGGPGLESRLFHAVTTGGLAWMVGLAVYGVVYWAMRARRPAAGPGAGGGSPC